MSYQPSSDLHWVISSHWSKTKKTEVKNCSSHLVLAVTCMVITIITPMCLPGLGSGYTRGLCCFYLQSTVLGGAGKTPSSGMRKVTLAKPQPAAAPWPLWAAHLGGVSEPGALWSCGVSGGLWLQAGPAGTSNCRASLRCKAAWGLL